MTVSLASVAANAEADATARLLDAGKIKIYAGSVPANANAALGGATLLSTLTFANPSAPGSSGGICTFSAITSDTDAAATGTATFFRITKSDGTVVGQGTVTATGGGGDLTLPTTSIVQHQTVAITSLTYTRPVT